MKQSILAAGAGEAYDWSSDAIVVKTPMASTDGRLTVVEDTLKAGFALPRHHHRSMVEVFYVLDGELTFTFDDEAASATTGMVVTVPPLVWHAVATEGGARLLTLFTPGGFDNYLVELASMDEATLGNANLVAALGERYDIWTH